jgi:hypothetical protein
MSKLFIDAQALGCDFLAFSSHKLCGLTCVGVLWARAELLEGWRPFSFGGGMIRTICFLMRAWVAVRREPAEHLRQWPKRGSRPRGEGEGSLFAPCIEPYPFGRSRGCAQASLEIARKERRVPASFPQGPTTRRCSCGHRERSRVPEVSGHR